MVCDDKLVDTDFNLVIGQVLKEKRLERNLSLLEKVWSRCGLEEREI